MRLGLSLTIFVAYSVGQVIVFVELTNTGYSVILLYLIPYYFLLIADLLWQASKVGGISAKLELRAC
ncbi:MAG: hypothetical protein ACW99U_15070 [Candidatus Thorarchaeota archaeon]